MPWNEVTIMSMKRDFIKLAQSDCVSFTELCKRFQISRKAGYCLLKRYQTQGEAGLQPVSRRPHHSPHRTNERIEDKILQVRKQRPYWGARKIRAYLLNQGELDIPAKSTVNTILHRQDAIDPTASAKRKPFIRFEHEAPNDLWQIDFKGHFAMKHSRCHPLTVLDDHSRFSIGLRACGNERKETIMPHFIEIFEQYGLPWHINFDNGSPWGSPSRSRYTSFSIWLMRLGIRVSFSRPRHPQTNGKDERFHRTLKTELLGDYVFKDLKEAQEKFDVWRSEYNYDRPHEALDLKPPISRYHMSPRVFPKQLPDIIYPDSDDIRQVNKAGTISYYNKKYFIGEGFRGLPLGIRQKEERKYDVYFCQQKIYTLILSTE